MPIDRSPSEIERDIDRERSELSATLSELGNRMTVDHLFREVGSQMRTHGGEFGRSAGTQLKNNPVALAITGVGLGWLIFGSNRPPQHHEDVQGIGRRDPYGYPPELTDVQSYRARSAHGAPAHGAPESASGSHGASWYDKARASVGSASSSVGERASQARNSASDGLGRAGQRAGESRDAAARRMNEMRERLREGTDHLSREGRDRVVAARERAMMARDQAGDNMRRGADAATDFYERQPLMAGMLALAAGALIAGVAARTRWEDERIGPYRDDLVDEAERIYAEESEKAAAVAGAARGEAESIAAEKRGEADASAPGDKSAVEQAGDEVRDAAKRIGEAGREEAERQDLGNPRQHH